MYRGTSGETFTKLGSWPSSGTDIDGTALDLRLVSCYWILGVEMLSTWLCGSTEYALVRTRHLESDFGAIVRYSGMRQRLHVRIILRDIFALPS